MNHTHADPTQRLLTAAAEWAASQSAALPDHARWAVSRRFNLQGFDAVVAILLQHGLIRLFTAGDDGEPELAATMSAVEAAE